MDFYILLVIQLVELLFIKRNSQLWFKFHKTICVWRTWTKKGRWRWTTKFKPNLFGIQCHHLRLTLKVWFWKIHQVLPYPKFNTFTSQIVTCHFFTWADGQLAKPYCHLNPQPSMYPDTEDQYRSALLPHTQLTVSW